MNIFQSIHPIHIPDAFFRAETQLRVGTAQSRDIGSGCGQNPVPPSSFNGLEKLQELLSTLQTVRARPVHSGTFLNLSSFLATGINNKVCGIHPSCQQFYTECCIDSYRVVKRVLVSPYFAE